ncbi:phage tail protein [Actinobacillus porcinus]|uniref:phage tail protein n=1 Tax=Actinobacillus porcinus TaxID=51048 RepID=UPI0023F164BD|nr:phage tail protein [Actinobacillus porcinus]MDD7545229.1 phage tail protein [Actinobacillus porcinus]
MYFMLGNIALEAIDLTEFSETHAAEFAEHAVLKGKPRLQAMGEKLNELSFAIRLHHKIGGVEKRYQALLKAKAEQNALALIWGRGKYKGNYVITQLTSNTLFTDKDGNALAREMNISLKEFVGETDGGLLGAALNFGGNSLLGSILPEGVVNTLSSVKAAVNRGVELYNQGKQLVNEVQNTVAVVRQLAHDPATALGYLPSVLGNLGGALGSFGEATGLTDMLSGLTEILPSAVQFAEEVGGIYSDLQTMKDCFSSADENTAWADWFTPADRALSSLNNRFDYLAKPVAEMTAWVVLRTDEENHEGDNATNLS